LVHVDVEKLHQLIMLSTRIPNPEPDQLAAAKNNYIFLNNLLVFCLFIIIILIS
jgi:hypothetical protein